MGKKSVVIADSECLARLGLRHLLSDIEGFQITGEAENEIELLDLLESNFVQLVILDHDQADRFSCATVSIIKEKYPTSNILIISADSNKKNIYELLENGVNSFITKTCGEEEIIEAIKTTAKGNKLFCTKVVDYLLEKSFSREEENCDPCPLSAREIEIVRLVSKGLIAKEIASILNLSTHTIYTHRKNIMRKLRLHTSSELVLYAVSNGWVETA